MREDRKGSADRFAPAHEKTSFSCPGLSRTPKGFEGWGGRSSLLFQTRVSSSKLVAAAGVSSDQRGRAVSLDLVPGVIFACRERLRGRMVGKPDS